MPAAAAPAAQAGKAGQGSHEVLDRAAVPTRSAGHGFHASLRSACSYSFLVLTLSGAVLQPPTTQDTLFFSLASHRAETASTIMFSLL